jgi:hypothetical protein
MFFSASGLDLKWVRGKSWMLFLWMLQGNKEKGFLVGRTD